MKMSDFKITKLEDINFTITMNYYDETFNSRVANDSYAMIGKFENNQMTVEFPIHYFYYQKFYAINGSAHINFNISVKGQKCFYNIFGSVLIDKENLSNLIKSKGDITYETEAFNWQSSHKKIPLILHFVKNNKFDIILSKISLSITEEENKQIYKYLITRESQARQGF